MYWRSRVVAFPLITNNKYWVTLIYECGDVSISRASLTDSIYSTYILGFLFIFFFGNCFLFKYVFLLYVPYPSHLSLPYDFYWPYTTACTVAYCTYTETAGPNCKQPIFPVANILPQIYVCVCVCVYIHIHMYMYRYTVITMQLRRLSRKVCV